MKWAYKVMPTVASLIVAVASFALSYVALRDVAANVGAVPPYLAFLVPVVIDGGVICGSVVIWANAQVTGRRELFPFVVVGSLVIVSVVVNTAHAGPTILAKGIAALPPLVLLATLELVAGQARRSAVPEPEEVAAVPAPTPAVALLPSPEEAPQVPVTPPPAPAPVPEVPPAVKAAPVKKTAAKKAPAKKAARPAAKKTTPARPAAATGEVAPEVVPEVVPAVAPTVVDETFASAGEIDWERELEDLTSEDTVDAAGRPGRRRPRVTATPPAAGEL